MEGQAVRRRISTITAHLSPSAEELSATHVLPMNCSSTLNSTIRRYDNALYFARQGCTFQPSFMRQGSAEEVVETENQNNSKASPNEPARRFDNMLFFARQGSAHQAIFMRQGGKEEVQPTEPKAPLKSSGPVTEYSYYVSQERPLFSRPSADPRFTSGLIHPAAFHGCKVSAADPPKFSIASRSNELNLISPWSPRMDAVGSADRYIVTVEIPGVGIKNIRVEVDERKLTVAGKRSVQCKNAPGCSNDPGDAYLRREIVQGPYSVVWPLPSDANKDCVSAEFQDGFLRVVIPKR